MRYLLDTSVVVSYLRDRLTAEQERQFISSLALGCAVSTITVAEYMEGAHRSAHLTRNLKPWEILRMQARIEVLPLEEEIAHVYGHVQAELGKAGRRLGSLDALIAATALHHKLTLVTQDHDFRRVPELDVSFVA